MRSFSDKLQGFIKAKSVTNKSILIAPSPTDNGTWYALTPKVYDFSFEKLVIGDKVSVSLSEDLKSVTFLEFIKKSEVKPIDKYPSQQEQAIIDEWNTSKSILWQSCMKVACEVEKAFMCGEKSPTRDEACKNICVSTNNLYEASLRKQRNLPPIPEVGE